MTADISSLRKEYTRAGLRRADLRGSPFNQFEVWFEQAGKAGIVEPNAMSLSTASPEGKPSVRTVLLKHYDEDGFIFFTNYGSPKARDIENNSNVAALFPWIAIERQVIIQGRAERVSSALSLKYFLSRPRGSQLGAWASQQSRVISSRAVLEKKLKEMKDKFQDAQIPLPNFWGGYRILPESVEFWQGRANRLHDRFIYQKYGDSQWKIHRKSP